MHRVPRTLTVLGLCLAAIAATATPAGAVRVASAKIDLHPNDNTLGNLSELGVLSRITGRATTAGVDARFPLDHGHVDPSAHFTGAVHGRGGLQYFTDDERVVGFKRPSILVSRRKVELFMSSKGESVRLATLRKTERTGVANGFQLKGLARFSEAGASVFAEAFGITYPHHDTPLGVLTIDARFKHGSRR